MPRRLAVPGSPGYVRERSEEIDRAELELNGESVPVLDGSPGPPVRGRGRETASSSKKKGKTGETKQTRKKRRKTPRKRLAVGEPESPPDDSPPPRPSTPPKTAVSEPKTPPPRRLSAPTVSVSQPPLPEPRPPIAINVLGNVITAPSHRDSEISVPLIDSSDSSSEENFNDTGSCRKISKREKRLLLALMIIAILCVSVPMLVTEVQESDDLPLPEGSSTASVGFGVVSFEVTDLTGGDLLPDAVTSELIRNTGFKVLLTITGGVFTSSQLVSFATNVPATREPDGLETHLKDPTFATYSTTSPTTIDVQIGPASTFKSYTVETLSIQLTSHLAIGHPVHVVIEGDVPELPQKSIRDSSSKAYAAGSIISSTAAVGSAASAGSLPKLMLITSAFECPTEDYFEIEWTHHPLLMLGFPTITWQSGDAADGLKDHVSAIVGNTILLIFSVILLVVATLALVQYRADVGWFHTPKTLGTRRLSFSAAASWTGFPHYLVTPLMFLSPGISVSCGSLFYYHPSTGAKLFAVVMLLLTCVVPGILIFWWLHGKDFNAEYVKIDEENGFFRFLLGTHEWTSKDQVLFYRTKLFFEDYKPCAKWFLTFELAIGIMFGLIEAIQPTSMAGCRWRSWSLLFLNTVYCLLVTFIRPMHVLVETVYMIPIAYVSEAILILILINHHYEDKDHWSADAAGTLSTVAMYLAMSKILVDIVIFLSELYVDRRNKRDEVEEVDQSSCAVVPPHQLEMDLGNKYTKIITVSIPDTERGKVVTHSIPIKVSSIPRNNGLV
eukprot:TRINITY_DN20144_c1_g1_i1.p1 TRINITY_DN20144_c1_g1~~TRINITY_DN20144_c1_g1_i1.p1  ORF type:complete len:783 (+),score=109.11 TRINITY_DN20144_c1_g1_i1:124-2472(+)